MENRSQMKLSKSRQIIPKLKIPAVKEAVCELRCDIAKPYSILPGSMYNRLKDSFPEIEELPFANLTSAPLPDELKFMVAHRFVNKKKNFLVQVGPKVCTVNALEPYSGFEEFSENINMAFETYKEISEPTAVHRIGLRYINLIPATSGG